MLRIATAIHARIIRDCDSRRPDEACGALLADRGGLIIDAVPFENTWPVPAERPNRFAIDPLAQLNIERNADASGLYLAGFYHSHPTALAVPSDFDRSRAWPTYQYVIVGYSDGLCVGFRSWTLDDGGAFVEHVVEIEG